MKALVVEDTAEILEVVAEFLREEGWQVECASSGCEAWTIFAARGSEFTLLLTDVIMPGLSGIDLARRARKAHPAICVLLMSGYLERNVDGFALVHKPFRRLDLINAITKILHCEC